MYYILLPFMAVVLVVLQSKLAEILFPASSRWSCR